MRISCHGLVLSRRNQKALHIHNVRYQRVLSITERFLRNAVKRANIHVKIAKNDFKIIMHAHKSLIYKKRQSIGEERQRITRCHIGCIRWCRCLSACRTSPAVDYFEIVNKENVGLYLDVGLYLMMVFQFFMMSTRKHFTQYSKEKDLILKSLAIWKL